MSSVLGHQCVIRSFNLYRYVSDRIGSPLWFVDPSRPELSPNKRWNKIIYEHVWLLLTVDSFVWKILSRHSLLVMTFFLPWSVTFFQGFTPRISCRRDTSMRVSIRSRHCGDAFIVWISRPIIKIHHEKQERRYTDKADKHPRHTVAGARSWYGRVRRQHQSRFFCGWHFFICLRDTDRILAHRT